MHIRTATAMLLVAGACVALTGCQGKAPDTKSPPVATVGDKTITEADLKAAEAGSPPPTNRDAAVALNREALQSIVNRELMARAADAQKLDKDPDVIRDSRWAVDGVKAAALAKSVMAKAAQPTSAEIDKFIADNPRAFRDRKFLVVDQLQVMGPMPAMPQTLPDSLDAYAAILDKANVPYQRRVDVVDTGAADPALLQKMLALPANSVFQVNNGKQVMVNQIREARPTPLVGPAAVQIARSYLANQAAEAAAKDYVEGLKKDGKTKITYQPGYEPAP